MSDFLEWTCKVDDVGNDGLALNRVAGEAEREAMASTLDIPSVERLQAALMLVGTGGGRYRLTGDIKASVTQACVVTLEPVADEIDEPVDVTLWPAEDIGPLADGEHSVLEGDTPEPIENGRIALGRLVFEHLAAALDPYPRKLDASFEGTEFGPRGAGDKVANPFAVLSRLKDKGEG